MSETAILLEKKEHIATVTLNRPPANSINLAIREGLDRALSEIEGDGDIRVVIITGAGEKGFSAGMDVGDTENLHRGPDAIELFNRIDRFARPVIAAINGYALGGACELALACHFRFMADTPKAVIGCPEVNLGITPGWGGIQRMARLLGRSRALELILFGRRLTPAEALAIGLVDRVFPGELLMAGTMEFAGALARKAPLAVGAVLKGMIAGMERGIEAGLEVDRACSVEVGRSEDAAEGIRAFMEKREPLFKGR